MFPSLSHLTLRGSLIFASLSFYACQDKAIVCDISEVRSCSVNGCAGQQLCNQFQSGWNPCLCDSQGGTTSTGSDGLGGNVSTGSTTDSSTTDTSTTDTSTTDSSTGETTTDSTTDSSTTDTTTDTSTTDTTTGDTGGDGDVDHGSVIYSGSGVAVSATDNDFGVFGSFYIRQDSYKDGSPVGDDGLTHTTVSPTEFNKSDTQPCISGTIAQITDGQYSAIWGALLGLEMAGGTSSWDATAQQLQGGPLDGLSFELSGSVGDAQLRVEAKVEGSDDHFCVMLEHEPGATGLFSVAFSDFEQNCYDNPGDATFDASKIVALEWIAMADPGSTSPVEAFCVQSIDVY